MKKIVSVVCLCLTLAIVFSSGTCGLHAFAAKQTRKNAYPFVFVHGYNGWGGAEGINAVAPYWGGTTGDLMKYLSKEGYECYSASVGPFSSAWDRACELYAQLTGQTVDYGEAHSKDHNHRRFGRTYSEPLFAGWGNKDANGCVKKIHLIGHSFGGTTIRMLTFLMTYGCPEEVKASKDGKVSALFTGGKENWIGSVTTIATPQNSATTYRLTEETCFYDAVMVFNAVFGGAAGRSPLHGKLYDFHLEQFSLSNSPNAKDADAYISAVKNYLENSDDSCAYDLTPEGTEKLNALIKTSPNVYYFSYAFDATHKDGYVGMTWPDITANPVLTPIGCWIGHHKPYTEKKTGQVYDDAWRPNDLLCNTISETYPFDESHADYDGTSAPQKGVWNVFPTQRGDHGQAVGLLTNAEKLHDFYIGHAAFLCSIEK
ncbi:MAG: lipase [Clostridia bacterium]|nr:lipase [Clostridia bacterium]